MCTPLPPTLQWPSNRFPPARPPSSHKTPKTTAACSAQTSSSHAQQLPYATQLPDQEWRRRGGVSGIRPRLVNCFQRRAPTTNRYSRPLLTFLLLDFPTAARVFCWIFTGLAAWQFSEIERFSEADGGVSTSLTRLIIRNIISFNLSLQ